MRELEKKIRAYIRQNDMLAPGDRVAAGVSGGGRFGLPSFAAAAKAAAGDPF